MALQFIFSGASLVLCAFFFIYFHFYIRRRLGERNILAGYQDEVNRLIAEIDRATDRDAQLVEERIAALRKILEDADRRIALLDRRRPSTELYTAQGKPLPPAPSPVPEIPASKIPVPEIPAPPAGEEGPAVPLTERVAELSRQGFAAELIASRLGCSLSEVELAIAVSRRRGA
ncbi:MAG: hypothetical protein LBB77_04045 [Treponema sp.]|nr:hypothetical protein [Treponema sp.]